jgi:hypothetical protein
MVIIKEDKQHCRLKKINSAGYILGSTAKHLGCNKFDPVAHLCFYVTNSLGCYLIGVVYLFYYEDPN